MATSIIIKPSQFNTEGHFRNTIWQNSETESVARNIVIICRKNHDSWDPFSADEYAERCKFEDPWVDIRIMDEFVQDGYLTKEDDKYSVTNRFIAALAAFVKD